jgi:hypothetical protein
MRRAKQDPRRKTVDRHATARIADDITALAKTETVGRILLRLFASGKVSQIGKNVSAAHEWWNCSRL